MASSFGRVIRGHCSGTMSPPSGARPSRRMSVKLRDAACPRVLTYFMTLQNRGQTTISKGRNSLLSRYEKCGLSPVFSKQLFQPDAHHGRGDGGKRLDARDRGVDALLAHDVGEDHDVDLVF